MSNMLTSVESHDVYYIRPTPLDQNDFLFISFIARSSSARKREYIYAPFFLWICNELFEMKYLIEVIMYIHVVIKVILNISDFCVCLWVCVCVFKETSPTWPRRILFQQVVLVKWKWHLIRCYCIFIHLWQDLIWIKSLCVCIFEVGLYFKAESAQHSWYYNLFPSICVMFIDATDWINSATQCTHYDKSCHRPWDRCPYHWSLFT